MRHTKNRVITALCILGAVLLWGLPAGAKDFIYAPTSNELVIIDCDSDTIVDRVSYNDYIIHAAFSPDGKRYYLNTYHDIHVIDTDTNKLIETFKFSSELNKVTVLGFAVSEDGAKLYLSCAIVKKKQNIPKLNVLPPQLVVFDIKSGKMEKNYPIPFSVLGVLTFRKDPDHLLLMGLDVHRLNLKTGEVRKVMGLLNPEAGEEAKNSLVIWHNASPGDHGIFTNPFYTEAGMGYIVVDRNSGEISTLAGKDVWFQYSTLVSPDKKYLYAVMDELIKIDMATGETVKAARVGRGTCYALSITADGKKIYVGPGGADISVFETENLELLGEIELAADGLISHRLTK
jgi:WD40 repeat protein